MWSGSRRSVDPPSPPAHEKIPPENSGNTHHIRVRQPPDETRCARELCPRLSSSASDRRRVFPNTDAGSRNLPAAEFCNSKFHPNQLRPADCARHACAEDSLTSFPLAYKPQLPSAYQQETQVQ